ncbi:MAG TPA: ABC transporter permease [Acidimicrobiales bacterium]|nr:ABC transporter permease [Acidimicrobiales bacterium]
MRQVSAALRRGVDVAGADNGRARAGRFAALIVGFFVVVQLVFHQSPANLVEGIALGSLYGIMGVGLVLIYRTTRIINFAAAAIGALPSILALLLVVEYHVDYLVVLPIAVIGGPLFGALTDILLMRRFANAPRLIVTVLTIGVAQTLGVLSFFIPIWMGQKATGTAEVMTPWQHVALHNNRGEPVLSGNQIAAIVVEILVTVGLILLLRRTRIGLALRASAENSDRAALLGIPVRRLGTVAWALAGLLSALAIFVQAPLIGVPSDATLGFDTLLYGLAAAVVARFNSIGLALGAGAGAGILVFASVQSTGSSDVGSATMFVVIMVALLLQRGSVSRALDTGVETWKNIKEYRPVPAVLSGFPEVRAYKIAVPVLAALVAVVVGLPGIGLSGPNIPDLVVLPIFGIMAVSLVVLTGWAGQISLGQFGLAAAGALVTGGLVAKHNLDFFVVLAIGIGAGVVVAVLIGLPAVRYSGMYLAVTTLAFSYAMTYYLMNNHYWVGAHLMPVGVAAQVNRPVLWGRVTLGDIGPNRNYYFVCLACLGLSMAAASSFRRMRSGRILIAVRDNPRAASSYSINVVRTRLSAFAVSGGIAGMAGVLLMYAQGNVIPSSFGIEYSIFIFLAVIVGGASSIPWAVIGAVSFEGFTLFAPKILDRYLSPTVTQVLPLILTGPGLIYTLIKYPSGNAEWGYELRDKFLRRVAAQRDVLVPSLVADRRVVTGEESFDAIEVAEHHMEEVHAAQMAGVLAGAPSGAGRGGSEPSGEHASLPAAPTITCPTCGQVLGILEATEHEHLRTAPPGEGTVG